MANTTVEFMCPTGMTLTLNLFPHGSDVLANPESPGVGDTCTERTNCKGVYAAIVTEALSGLYDVLVVDADDNQIANYHVDLEDDTETYRCGDWFYANIVEISAESLLDIATSVGTNSAAAIADAVFDEPPAEHPTADSFGKAVTDNAVAVASLGADIYDAEHDFSRGDSIDEHRVTWFNKGARQTTVTDPTIAIYDNDGAAILTATAMTDLGSGDLRYDATGAERMTVGESYKIVMTATIDAATRTWVRLVSRDIGPAATFGQDDYDAIAAGVRVQIASSMDSVVSGSDITIHRGDTITISLADLGNVSSRTKLWFTIKGSLDDEDSESIILATEADGLVTIIGRDPVSGETCTITVTDEATGAVTIVLSAGAAKVLTLGSGKYDIQIKTSTEVTTLTEGEFIVAADVTKAIA